MHPLLRKKKGDLKKSDFTFTARAASGTTKAQLIYHSQQQHRFLPLSLAELFQGDGATHSGSQAGRAHVWRQSCHGSDKQRALQGLSAEHEVERAAHFHQRAAAICWQAAGRRAGTRAFPNPSLPKHMKEPPQCSQEQPTALYLDEILETDTRDKRN